MSGYNKESKFRNQYMRTLFLCSDNKVEAHVGEEYDEFLIVPEDLTTSNFGGWRTALKKKVIHLALEGGKDSVTVYLDCPAPFLALLIDLQVILRTEGDVTIYLNGGAGKPTPLGGG